MEEEARTLLRVALRDDIAAAGSLADAIRARFRRLGGVELRVPVREPMREPPNDRTDFDGCGVTLVDPWKP